VKTIAVAISVASLLAIQCPPNPAPVPPDVVDAAPTPIPDAAPSPPAVDAGTTACDRGCSNLARLGCAEGNAQCPATCTHVVAAKLTPIDPACWASAASKTAARSCKGLERGCP